MNIHNMPDLPFEVERKRSGVEAVRRVPALGQSARGVAYASSTNGQPKDTVARLSISCREAVGAL